DGSGSLSVSAEISEVFLMQNGRICGDQLFHLQTFDLKAWRVIWQSCEHLLNLANPACSSGIVVVVMRHDQLLGKALQLFRIKWQWLDCPAACSWRLSLQFGV